MTGRLELLLLKMFAAVLRASKYIMYQCSLDSKPCFGNNGIILTQTAFSTFKSDDLSLLKNLPKKVAENSTASLYLEISLVLEFEQSSAESHSIACWSWADAARENQFFSFFFY